MCVRVRSRSVFSRKMRVRVLFAFTFVHSLIRLLNRSFYIQKNSFLPETHPNIGRAQKAYEHFYPRRPHSPQNRQMLTKLSANRKILAKQSAQSAKNINGDETIRKIEKFWRNSPHNPQNWKMSQTWKNLDKIVRLVRKIMKCVILWPALSTTFLKDCVPRTTYQNWKTCNA